MGKKIQRDIFANKKKWISLALERTTCECRFNGPIVLPETTNPSLNENATGYVKIVSALVLQFMNNTKRRFANEIMNWGDSIISIPYFQPLQHGETGI